MAHIKTYAPVEEIVMEEVKPSSGIVKKLTRNLGLSIAFVVTFVVGTVLGSAAYLNDNAKLGAQVTVLEMQLEQANAK